MGWKRNPWSYLYDWIRGLEQAGYDQEKMLNAFEVMPYTRLDRNNPEEVEFALVLINDALGKLPYGEIDKYILPSDVVGFSPAFDSSEGYVFTAHTPSGEKDFLFLVEKNLYPGAKDIDQVMAKLAMKSSIVNKLVLQRFHTRHPYSIGNGEVAKAKISFGD